MIGKLYPHFGTWARWVRGLTFGSCRPTPRIVLDILGVPESVDPEPLSFESLGEGQKQHNMGKVYSGLYEVQGHIVPFIVIVKVGKPSEVSRYVDFPAECDGVRC